MGMGVLTRYLIRVHVGPFLFALSTLTALIFLNAVAQRIEGLLGKGLLVDGWWLSFWRSPYLIRSRCPSRCRCSWRCSTHSAR